jgi:hypothetical protein
MKRLLAILVAVFALSGCRSQGPAGTDPFFGRTRVPPPGTGAISGGSTDPYYGGAPYSTAPPAVTTPQMPPATGSQPPSASGGQNYVPPGGTLNYQGSSWTPMGPPKASQSDTSSSLSDRSLPAKKATSTPASRQRVVQALQPRTKAAAGSPQIRIPASAIASAADEPRELRVPEGAIEITDLPPVGGATSAARSQSASGGSGVRLASGIQQPDVSAGVAAAVAVSGETTGGTPAAESAPRAGYGYDPEYHWLRGKLEYSQIDRRWKLRYIPVEGDTDQFGGSVVLPDAKVLAGCERGDFIEVRGQVDQQNTKNGYAPTYKVVEVKGLSQGQP